MPKFLVSASYTAEGAKGLLAHGGSARVEASRAAIESVGGTLETFYFAFGSDDAVIIADFPDNAAAAAVALAVASTGAITSRMTVLLTPEEIDQSVARPVTFIPPRS
jgi:uncharacterized protein with GYD domain